MGENKMNDFIMIMGSYTVIIVISFGILGWLQAGFLMPFLKVKLSRGKKILVKILKETGSDFVAAELIEGALVFKYKKEKKQITKFSGGIHRAYNMNCVAFEGSSWAVITPKGVVSTNDPTKTDMLIERALMRPDKKITKEGIIIFLGIITVVLLLFVAYKLNFAVTLLQAGNTVSGVNL